MNTRLLASLLFLVALLSGCATAEKLNQLQIGMTKDQVIGILGRPDSMSAQGNIEYLTYYLTNESPRSGGDQPYSVRMVNGQVESFGRFMQLFDIYNRPVSGTNPNGVGPMAAAPAAPISLAGELQKLKALKDQGVLTEEEFQQAKAKLLGK